MFKKETTCNNHTDIEEYTDTVTSCMKSIDELTHTKTIIIRANLKPWLTGDVHQLLRTRDNAFRAGDKTGLRHRSLYDNISLLNNLNSFFARFEATNPQKTPPTQLVQPDLIRAHGDLKVAHRGAKVKCVVSFIINH